MTDDQIWWEAYCAVLGGAGVFISDNRLATTGSNASTLTLTQIADTALKEWKERCPEEHIF